MPSIEMTASAMARLFREGYEAADAGERLVERHSDQADDEDGDDHVGDRQIVPFIPDEVADARAADEHLGRDDDEPGDADRDAHAGDDRRRGVGQDHGEGAPYRPDLERTGDVEPFLPDARDA